MEMKSIFESLGKRMEHGILIGVTGPMRTGKSTFVKRFMEELVLPNMADPQQAERARDELPQSGSGKTIMTTEPKFVPEEPVTVTPDGVTYLAVRLIDSVGYPVDGVVGADEDGQPRLVTTPWFDYEIPMTQAAEMGTKKVMDDHCTVGIVVTTDGTVTDLDAVSYQEAESRAIRDMQATGKPFVVIVNSAAPQEKCAQDACSRLRQEFGVSVLTANCLTLTQDQMCGILAALLYEFPVTELHFSMPNWVMALEDGHPLKQTLYDAMRSCASEVARVCQAEPAIWKLMETQILSGCRISSVDPGSGVVRCVLEFPEETFYRVLSEQSGFQVENDGELMGLLTTLSKVKMDYDQIAEALEEAKRTGYGIVLPCGTDMKLEPPQMVKKGGNFAINLKASAPALHLICTDVHTEVCPTVGDEKQTRELADSLLTKYQEHSDELWQCNFFGKSLHDLVSEGLAGKIGAMNAETRCKLRDSMTRIVNENTTGLIYIIL